MTTLVRAEVAGGVGVSVVRPDGIPKVKGEFAFSSDLSAEGMLWGATVRSPHPHARIVSIDVVPALAIPGVRTVLTQDDVPGRRHFGLERPDQPVLADGEVCFWGQPVAVVAADDRETARRRIVEDLTTRYNQPFEPLVDRYCAFGTAADCAATIGGFLEAGVSNLVLKFTCTPAEQLDQQAAFAERVLPLIRRL